MTRPVAARSTAMRAILVKFIGSLTLFRYFGLLDLSREMAATTSTNHWRFDAPSLLAPKNMSAWASNLQGAKPDLQEIADELKRLPPPSTTAASQRDAASRSKTQIANTTWLDVLKEKSVDLEDNAEQIKQLPAWEEISQLYGPKMRILGLETCAAFRESIDPARARIGIAGLFNSNTNHIYKLVDKNCKMPGGYDKVMWQVPWYKHALATERGHFLEPKVAAMFKRNNSTVDEVFPIAMVRDPYFWMQSTCKNHYSVIYENNQLRCPKLIHRYANGTMEKPVNIFVKYRPDFRPQFPSTLHYWQEWNQLYLNVVTYPRLMVRFEDVVYHTKEVVEAICECAGGKRRRRDFDFVLSSSSRGVNKTDWLEAAIKYGTQKDRVGKLDAEELKFAASVLDPELLRKFGYQPMYDGLNET